MIRACDCIREVSGSQYTRGYAVSRCVGGFCAIVEWVNPTLTVRNRQLTLVSQIMPFFIVWPLHCCSPLCFYFDHVSVVLVLFGFIFSLYHTVALHRFIRQKTILVVSSTFCRNIRCKCLYIVQHLYKYLLSALSGRKNRGILNGSIIFLCKERENI